MQKNFIKDMQKYARKMREIDYIKPVAIKTGVKLPRETHDLLYDFKEFLKKKVIEKLEEVEEKSGKKFDARVISRKKIENLIDNGVILAGGYPSDIVLVEKMGIEKESNDIDIFILNTLTNIVNVLIQKIPDSATDSFLSDSPNLTPSISRWFKIILGEFFDHKTTEVKNEQKNETNYFEDNNVVHKVFKTKFRDNDVDIVFFHPPYSVEVSNKDYGEQKPKGIELGKRLISTFDFTFRQFFAYGEDIYGFKHSINDMEERKLKVFSIDTPRSTLVRLGKFKEKYNFDMPKIDKRLLGVIVVENFVQEMTTLLPAIRCNKKNAEKVLSSKNPLKELLKIYKKEISSDPNVIKKLVVSAENIKIKKLLKKLINDKLSEINGYEKIEKKTIEDIVSSSVELFFSTDQGDINEYFTIVLMSKGDPTNIFRKRNKMKYMYDNNLFKKMTKNIEIELETFNYINFLEEFILPFDGKQTFDKLEESIKLYKMFDVFSSEEDDRKRMDKADQILENVFGYSQWETSIFLVNYEKTWGIEQEIHKKNIRDKKELKNKFLSIWPDTKEERTLNFIQFAKTKSRYLSDNLRIQVCARDMFLYGENSPIFKARFSSDEIEELFEQAYLREWKWDFNLIHKGFRDEVESNQLTFVTLKNKKTGKKFNTFIYNNLEMRLTKKDREKVIQQLSEVLGLRILNYSKKDKMESIEMGGGVHSDVHIGEKEGYDLNNCFEFVFD